MRHAPSGLLMSLAINALAAQIQFKFMCYSLTYSCVCVCVFGFIFLAATTAPLGLIVPETSYSSSEGEDDFYDAYDDPFTSVGNSPIGW